MKLRIFESTSLPVWQRGRIRENMEDPHTLSSEFLYQAPHQHPPYKLVPNIKKSLVFSICKGAFAFVLLIIIPASISAQPLSDSIRYYYEPLPLRSGQSVMNLGLSLSLLPAPIVEQELPAPAIDWQFKYGFNSNFSLYSSLSTNIFTNALFGGLQYNNGDEKFSYSAGAAVGMFAGFFDLGGEFDKNSAAAVAIIPSLRFGRRFGLLGVSLSFHASYVLYADTHVGSLEDKGLRSRFNDIYVTLALEQPFFGRTSISTGLSVTYSRTPYQIWMLYNVFDQYLVIPEFFFSFHL